MPGGNNFGPLTGGGLGNFGGRGGILGQGGFTADPSPPPPPPPPPGLGLGAGLRSAGVAGLVGGGGFLLGYGVGSAFYDAVGDPNSWQHGLVAALTDPLRQYMPPPPDASKGGGEAQESESGKDGKTGQVVGALYGIVAEGVIHQGKTGYSPTSLPISVGAGPVELTKISAGSGAWTYWIVSCKGFSYTGFKFAISGGGTYSPSQLYTNPANTTVSWSTGSFKLVRMDGTPEATDKEQDPNAKEGSPGVSVPGGTNNPSGQAPTPGGNKQGVSPPPPPPPPPIPFGDRVTDAFNKGVEDLGDWIADRQKPPVAPSPTPRTPVVTPKPPPEGSKINDDSGLWTTQRLPNGGAINTLHDPNSTGYERITKVISSSGKVLWEKKNGGPNMTPELYSELSKISKAEKDQTEWLDIRNKLGIGPNYVGVPLPPVAMPVNATPINPKTSEPVKTQLKLEDPKAPPPVGTPNNSGSSCAYPAFHGQVMGGHTASQAQITGVNTVLTGTTNVQLLEVNTKLGSQLIDGLGGTLNRIIRSDVVDRAINLLTLATAIHNGLMLSRDFATTITETLSNVLASVGIKDADGNAFDLNQVFGKQLEDLLKGIVGIENYSSLKKVWVEANRILTVANNLLNAVRAEHGAIMQGVEVVANMNSQLNNALKIEGMCNDDLLDYEPTNYDFNGRFGRAQQVMQNLTEAAESINQLAQAAIEIQQSTTELNAAWTQFNDEVLTKKEEKRTEEATKDTENVPPNSELLDFVRHQAED